MYKAKNIQTFLNLPSLMERKLLKFCYFMIALVFISCGNTNTAKDVVETKTSIASDNEIITVKSKKTILCFGDSLTAGMGLEDSNDAMIVADKMGIPFQVVDLSEQYKERIVDYMFKEYELGDVTFWTFGARVA